MCQKRSRRPKNEAGVDVFARLLIAESPIATAFATDFPGTVISRGKCEEGLDLRSGVPVLFRAGVRVGL
jgi:hypothetical protein